MPLIFVPLVYINLTCINTKRTLWKVVGGKFVFRVDWCSNRCGLISASEFHLGLHTIYRYVLTISQLSLEGCFRNWIKGLRRKCMDAKWDYSSDTYKTSPTTPSECLRAFCFRSVRPSMCLSDHVNVLSRYPVVTFELYKVVFVCGTHIHWVKHFQRTSMLTTMWPWRWSRGKDAPPSRRYVVLETHLVLNSFIFSDKQRHTNARGACIIYLYIINLSCRTRRS